MANSITVRDLNQIWRVSVTGADHHVFWCRAIPYALKVIFGSQSEPIQKFLFRAESFMHLRRAVADPLSTFWLGNVSHETRFLNIVTWVHNLAEGVLLLDGLGFKAERMTGSRLQTARMLQDLIDFTNVVIAVRRMFSQAFTYNISHTRRLTRSTLFPDSPPRGGGDDGSGGDGKGRTIAEDPKPELDDKHASSGGSASPKSPDSRIGPEDSGQHDDPIGATPARPNGPRRENGSDASLPWYERLFSNAALFNIKSVTGVIEVGARALVAIETLYRRVGCRENFRPIDSSVMPVYLVSRLLFQGVDELTHLRTGAFKKG